MAGNTKIGWAHHTFNPWIGCTRVSPACDNCYAARSPGAIFNNVLWGPGEPRHRTTTSWEKPPRWNRKAEKLGIRYRVFCASLADVFDTEVPVQWRAQLFDMVEHTPHLDWLLLTKRPSEAWKYFKDSGRDWPNVWLGTTVENNQTARARIGFLAKTPNVAKRFLSMEPLLEDVDLEEHSDLAESFDWIIVGGESGPKHRPFDADHARSVRDFCTAYGIAFFMKQMAGNNQEALDAIPDDLMIREFPTEAA